MHCHFMPYHCIVTTCPGISYHFIIIHNTSLYDNITSLHFMSHLGISYQIMAFHAISWHFIPHLGISYSYHIKAFHTTSWHFTPYGISYNIIFHTTTYGMSYHITYNTYVSYIYIYIYLYIYHVKRLQVWSPEPASTDAVDQFHRGLVALGDC